MPSLAFLPVAPRAVLHTRPHRLASGRPSVRHYTRPARSAPRACARAAGPSRTGPPAAAREEPAEGSEDAVVLQRLRSFLDANGVRLHGVEIRAEAGGQRGLFATRDLPAGADLLSIPRAASLLEGPPEGSHATLHVFRVADAAAWRAEPWYVRLAVRLLDAAAAPAHPRAPYIDALPHAPGSALWAMHERGAACVAAQLEAYGIAESTTRLYDDVCAAHARFQAMLPADAPALHAAASRDRFVWAVSVVLSRAFAVPPAGAGARSGGHTSGAGAAPTSQQQQQQQLLQTTPGEPTEFALFPALDMANHSVRAASTLRYDAAADSYVVRSARAHARGDQVFVSYGARGNDELVQFYGVAEGGNPANSVAIRGARAWLCALARATERASASASASVSVSVSAGGAPATGRLCAARKQKFVLLRRLGVPPLDAPLRLRADGDEGALLATLRVVLADEGELAALCASPERAHKPLSLRGELAVWDALGALCDALLNDTPSFDACERARLTALFARRDPCAGWAWRDASDPEDCSSVVAASDGELLFRYERDAALDAARGRVRHFAKVSAAVGRVCTVLLPGQRSVVRAERFDAGAGAPDGASGAGAGMVSFDVDALLGLHASMVGEGGGDGGGDHEDGSAQR